MKLSQERALAVKDFLVSKGIPGDKISSLGLGPNKPVESNDTDAGKSKNRRIEFKILSF